MPGIPEGPPKFASRFSTDRCVDERARNCKSRRRQYRVRYPNAPLKQGPRGFGGQRTSSGPGGVILTQIDHLSRDRDRSPVAALNRALPAANFAKPMNKWPVRLSNHQNRKFRDQTLHASDLTHRAKTSCPMTGRLVL